MSTSQQSCSAFEPPTAPSAPVSTTDPSVNPTSKPVTTPPIDTSQMITLSPPSTLSPLPNQSSPQPNPISSSHPTNLTIDTSTTTPSTPSNQQQSPPIYENNCDTMNAVEQTPRIHPDDYVQLGTNTTTTSTSTLTSPQLHPNINETGESNQENNENLVIADNNSENDSFNPIPAFLLSMTGTKRSLSRPMLASSMDDSQTDNSNANDMIDGFKRQRLGMNNASLSLPNNPITSLSMRATLTNSTANNSTATSTSSTPLPQSNNGNNNNNTNATPAKLQGSSNKLLLQQYKDLMKSPPPGVLAIDIETSNIYKWKVTLIGPSETPFEGGIFPCAMHFPSDYPTSPPTFSFTTPGFCHPNVFPDGKVCISILHSSTESIYDHEPQSERWKPIIGIEAILISVISLLNEPNIDSPANVEMARLFRDNTKEYRKRIVLMVRRSQQAALDQ